MGVDPRSTMLLSDFLCGCYGSNPRSSASGVGTPRPVQPQGHGASARPQQARNYEANCEDDIDVQLSRQLQSLDEDAAASLVLRHIRRGHYEINGRRVRLAWAAWCVQSELVVLEGEEGAQVETPLSAYVQQVVSVNIMLAGKRGGSAAVTRVPVDQRLTFANLPPHGVLDSPGTARVQSMQMACEQARLREQAAEAYERGRRDPRLPPSAMTPPVLAPFIGKRSAKNLARCWS